MRTCSREESLIPRGASGRVADVVLGALVSDGAVLLARRSPLKRHHPDIWDLPGGTVEPLDSELHALARELREEVGVDIETVSATHL